MGWAGIALLVAGAGLWPGLASAYIPGLNEFFARVEGRSPDLQRAIITSRTIVYDPFGYLGEQTAANAHPDDVPPVAAKRTYRQRIYWIRGKFLGIETYSEEGQLVHFYLNEGYLAIQGPVNSDRHFAEADILPPYLPFLEGSANRWREGLSYWGVHPQRIELEMNQKGRLAYRLVDGSSGEVWVDPERLRPFRIRTTIHGATTPRTLTLEFGNFIVMQPEEAGPRPAFYYYPLHSEILLDGRLMRETIVDVFLPDPTVAKFPITKLRKLANTVQPPQPFSLIPRN